MLQTFADFSAPFLPLFYNSKCTFLLPTIQLFIKKYFFIFFGNKVGSFVWSTYL